MGVNVNIRAVRGIQCAARDGKRRRRDTAFPPRSHCWQMRRRVLVVVADQPCYKAVQDVSGLPTSDGLGLVRSLRGRVRVENGSCGFGSSYADAARPDR